jgi:hypothetical protein
MHELLRDRREGLERRQNKAMMRQPCSGPSKLCLDACNPKPVSRSEAVNLYLMLPRPSNLKHVISIFSEEH